MQFGAFMVPVTFATIMKTSKILTKNMSPGKDQRISRSGKRIIWLELQVTTGS